MKAKVVNFRQPVTLVGGGEMNDEVLRRATSLAPVVVAADGAADRLARPPDAIIGDMDSISDTEKWRRSDVQFLQIDEQDSTDFEKCLYATEAPYYIGVGFTGRRMDHTLAVFHAMLAHPEKRVVLVTPDEAIALIPPGISITIELPQRAVVSLFPLTQATGLKSEGLRWSVEGLELAPGRQIGTSNRATGGHVTLAFDRPGVLLLLEAAHLPAIVSALGYDRVSAASADAASGV